MASEAELLALADDLDRTIVAYAQQSLEAERWGFQCDAMAYAANAAIVAQHARARAATMGGSDE